MSNTLLNWRFGAWHLKIFRGRPWVGVSWNPFHAPELRPDDWRWFERY